MDKVSMLRSSGRVVANENLMKRIQGLLDKAESSEFPQEAQSYRETAERIMAKYAIEEAMLAHSRMAQGVDDRPEQRNIDFCDMYSPMVQELFSIMLGVCDHNRCRFLGFMSGKGIMVGYEKDMDYAEMMYAQLRLQLLNKVDPKPNLRLTFDENVYILHEAGIKWAAIASMMNRELARWLAGETDVLNIDPNWEKVPWEVDGTGKGKKDGGRLIRAAKRWCKHQGFEYVAIQEPAKFRRSYAEGFMYEVTKRLRDLRQHTRDQVRSTSGAEVALMGREDRVNKAFKELEELMGVNKPQSETDHNGKKRKTPKYNPPKTDWSAFSRGEDDGAKADLGNRAGSLGGKKGIGS